MYYEKAKSFIYQNARPLDIARWKYLFENGSKEEVLTALAVYQNDDGGFGHALEADCWNPNSSPIQTWCATKIIKEIELEDKNHPIIQGILKYLSSVKDFDGHTWLNTIASNDEYPHAPWWNFNNKEVSYNPTASLIGFIIKFAAKESSLYDLAITISQEAYSYLKRHFPIPMHTVACFVELYEYLKESKVNDILDLNEFRDLLEKQINHVITYDTARWTVDYICKPSLFINNKESDFYLANKEICTYEGQFLLNSQNDDGTWKITWSWEKYPEEWSISKNWWKADLIINNVKYIKAMINY